MAEVPSPGGPGPGSASSPTGAPEAVPQWKRDLLERRRASGRSISASSSGLGVVSLGLTCPGVVAAVRHPGQGPAAAAGPSGPSASDFHQRARAGARSAPESPAEPPRPQPDRDRASAAAAAESVPVGVPVGFDGGNMRLVEQLQLQRDDITFNGQDDLKQRFINMGEEKMLLPLSGPRALARVPRAAKQYLAKVANQKNGTPTEDECNSDSSEELQYGPGIVKKLKNKYLTMTLRESSSRPSLSCMRRATSLENLLDEETTIIKPTDTKPAQFVKRVTGNNTVKVVTHQSRSVEPSQRDMKRARSMETLLRYDPKLHTSHSNSGLNVHLEDAEKDENDSAVNDIRERSSVQHRKSTEGEKEDQILLRKKLAITFEETELPPPDLVKQTLKIFESSGSPGSASPPVPQARNSVNKNVNFKTNNAKPVPKVKNSVSKKPQVSPKPVFSPEKLRSPKVASPKKSVDVSDKVPSDSVSASVRSGRGDTSPVPVSPVSPLSSPVTPPTSAVTPIQVRNSTKRSPPSPRKTMGLPVLSPTEDKPPPIPRRDKSPSSSAPVTPGTPVTPVTPLTPTTPIYGSSNGRPESLDIRPIYSASDSDGEIDDVDAVSSKSVSSSALENIRKDGTSMQFSFGSTKSPANDTAKSYLPGVKPTPPKDLPIPPKSTPTNCVRSVSPFESHNQDHATRPGSVINVASLPHGAVLKSPESPVQHAKQVGVIRPLVSTKHHSPHNISPTPATPTTLTNREIEKNLINRAKSIEQPVTKVVVSLKKLPDDVVVGSVSHSALAFAVNGDQAGSTPAPVASKRGQAPGLWDKKPWHHQDNTMVFNFSNRKEVPDYIENDGLILRGNKREKQRDGGGAGGVLLLGASAGDESSTDGDMGDVDEWGLVSCDPPSPCTVVFEGSNVIINGRSNLRKQQSPRQPRKLRIQFNDEATTMFEYPSEASLLEDGAHGAAPPPPPSGPAPAPPSSAPAPGLPVPLGSGSLASYTPSKLQMGVSETFQLGVTRAPSSSSPSSSSPDDAASGASTASSVDTIEADHSDLGDSDHLKPAREGESVTWSEESGTDLLF
ncbi:uncharacterized protein LOC113203792 [Frankliniella occidentalis]|uniref:Uncharacterized protein LOC113203792 n=1 Tax=Frankliniella occidentalis TaxID=133901 RepID=A0A6J1S5G7_FRAOC|nr:uncharacterized protein LOC113203792 [Frankliniella occidentalis]